MARRFVLLAVILYLAAALRSLAKESQGELQCPCQPDCWCKKPGLALFRWVFPFRHSLSD